MKLRWTALERALKSRVRPYDARRQMTCWQRVDHFLNSSPTIPSWTGRGLVSVMVISVAVGNRELIQANPDAAMTALSLWGLWIATLRAGMMARVAEVDPVYGVLWILPVSVNRTYRRLLSKVAAGALWFFGEALVLYGLVASRWTVSTVGLVLAASAAQALASLALTCLVVRTMVKLDKLLTGLFLVTSLLLLSSNSAAEQLMVRGMYWLSPFGWINRWLLEAGFRGHLHAGWWAVPVSVLVGSLPWSLKRIRELHRVNGLRSPGIPDLGGRAAQVTSGDGQETATLRSAVLSGAFLRPWSGHFSGPLERLIERLLNQSERLSLETLVLSEPPWSKGFLKLMIYFGLYLVVSSRIQSSSFESMLVSVFGPRRIHLGDLLWFGASVLLFTLFLAKGFSLFVFLSEPERPPNPRSVQVGVYRQFRLLPINYWHTASTKAATSTIVLAGLLPFAMAFSFTQAFHLVFRAAPQELSLPPKSLLALWGCLVVLHSFGLSPSVLHGLKYWKYSLRKVLALFVFGAMTIGLLVSRNAASDALLVLMVILGAPAWLWWSGRQYRQAGRV